MIIKVFKKSSYGNEYIYPLNYQKELKQLTGKKTLSKADVEALKVFSIEFELVQGKI